MVSNISGVILAGGANTRFKGEIKSKLVIGGIPIIERIIDTIRDIFDEIIIVTNNPEEFSEYVSYKITRDHFLKTGPLGGIHAALKASGKDAVFVFAGDMPHLDNKLINRQIDIFNSDKYEILVPRINGNIEPLHSIYNNSLRKTLEEYLKSTKNFAVRDFFSLVNINYMDLEESLETEKAFININQPSDVLMVEKILKSGSH